MERRGVASPTAPELQEAKLDGPPPAAPAEAPRVVILALLDEPATSSYGGIVAAPIFQAIAAGAMERRGVASPTAPENRSALFVIGAVSIVAGAGQGGGLYWVGLEVIGALVWAIAGAWRFLIGVVDDRRS
jgi:hypothetical protein